MTSPSRKPESPNTASSVVSPASTENSGSSTLLVRLWAVVEGIFRNPDQASSSRPDPSSFEALISQCKSRYNAIQAEIGELDSEKKKEAQEAELANEEFKARMLDEHLLATAQAMAQLTEKKGQKNPIRFSKKLQKNRVLVPKKLMEKTVSLSSLKRIFFKVQKADTIPESIQTVFRKAFQMLQSIEQDRGGPLWRQIEQFEHLWRTVPVPVYLVPPTILDIGSVRSLLTSEDRLTKETKSRPKPAGEVREGKQERVEIKLTQYACQHALEISDGKSRSAIIAQYIEEDNGVEIDKIDKALYS
ncbi:MAG: hypothetical protein AAGF04_01955 [Chlamydiota bacterium]